MMMTMTMTMTWMMMMIHSVSAHSMNRGTEKEMPDFFFGSKKKLCSARFQMDKLGGNQAGFSHQHQTNK